jgi:hypothetical protein
MRGDEQMTFSILRSLSEIPSLAARVLSDEAHFGDGPPTWPNAPTSAEAGKARLREIKRLRRFADNFAGAGLLADDLADCKPGDRCMSGACPECTRGALPLPGPAKQT